MFVFGFVLFVLFNMSQLFLPFVFHITDQVQLKTSLSFYYGGTVLILSALLLLVIIFSFVPKNCSKTCNKKICSFYIIMDSGETFGLK